MDIKGDSLDDLLRTVFRRITRDGRNISPRKGDAREIIGTKLTLLNPRARFSRAETRSVLFSCLGEFMWIISGSQELAHIEYYIRRYRESSNDKIILRGAYGPRIFGGENSQFDQVADAIVKNTDSRQNVIQIFNRDDLLNGNIDVPCTTALQFFKRQNRLHMLVTMRSNYAYIGLPHDVFCFTMIQEIMCRKVGCDLGEYHHVVGSLHLYDINRVKVREYLGEAMQSRLAMPPMPDGDPMNAIATLIRLEERFRSGATEQGKFPDLDPYWGDLARLLMAKRLFVDRKHGAMRQLRKDMHSRVYDQYIRGQQDRIAPVDTGQEQLALPNFKPVAEHP